MRTSASLRRCRVSDESTCKRGYSEQLLCLTDLRAASSEFGVGGVPEECPAQVLRDGAFAASRFASLPRHLAPTRALHLPTRTPHHDVVLRCARERPWLTIRHWGAGAGYYQERMQYVLRIFAILRPVCMQGEVYVLWDQQRGKKPKTEITEPQKPASHHHLACAQLTAPTRRRARRQGH